MNQPYSNYTIAIFILLAIIILIWFSGDLFAFLGSVKDRIQNRKKEDFENPPYLCNQCDVSQEPEYLKSKENIPESEAYAYGALEKQANEIRRLRRKIKRLAMQVDDNPARKFYRTKLSNKYYQPKPMLAVIPDLNAVNLNDDDFSTKTMSTIKFLSQTRPSKFYGDEIHFPNELCGSYCETNDKNVQLHEQIDLVRPIAPLGYIRTNK